MSIPAGWYDDGQGQQRWWDGSQWTDQMAPASTPAAPAPVPSFGAAPPPAPAYGAPAPGITYGAPDAAAPAKKKSLAGLFVVLGIVAVLVIGGIIAALLFALGGNKDGAGSPEEAVENAYNAILDGDCEEAAKYVYKSSDKDIEQCEDAVESLENSTEDGDLGEFEFEVVDSEVDGDEAVVTLEITLGDMSVEDEIQVEKHDGRWFVAESLGSGGGSDDDADGDADEDPEPTADDETDDPEPTGDIGGSSDLDETGTLFDPSSSVDMSDPVQVAAAFEWTNYVTMDCAENLKYVDLSGDIAFGETEEEYCEYFFGPYEPFGSEQIFASDAEDLGDGTVAVYVLYLDTEYGTEWEEGYVLAEVDGEWKVVDYYYGF